MNTRSAYSAYGMGTGNSDILSKCTESFAFIPIAFRMVPKIFGTKNKNQNKAQIDIS